MKKLLILSLAATAIILVLVAARFGFQAKEKPMPQTQSPPSSSYVDLGPTPPPRARASPDAAVDTSNWEIYRNETFGFELKYPPSLDNGKTLGRQPFNCGLEGSPITTFSDARTHELVLCLSTRSLDGYIVQDNPAGVYYRFDSQEKRWVSSVSGTITGGEPRPLDTALRAYGYATGDGRCGWQGAVVPHPKDMYILELILVSCRIGSGEAQELSLSADVTTLDVTTLVRHLRFTEKH